MTSKNDRAWNKVFNDLNLLDSIQKDGHARISASTLKEVGGREPRLMAKQDTLESRPDIFRKHQLVILPIKNGEYIIFQDPDSRSYFQFDLDSGTIPIEIHESDPYVDRLETLDLGSISGEFQALDYANIASVLKTYTHEPELFLTIRGRLRSSSFSIALPGRDESIPIQGVQMEIDSGFEGSQGIYLIEAKMGKRQDFHIRQLYFPWKDWSSRSQKPVIPIFFSYSNGLFYLTTFQFGERYGVMEIVDQRCFSVDEDPFLVVEYDTFSAPIPVDPCEPDTAPFPQANDIDKIIDLVISFNDELDTKEAIAEYFEFDERQGDYYANAAIYLGFLERGETRGQFVLTPLGYELKRCKTRRCRNGQLLTQLFKRPTFRYSIELLRESNFDIESISTQSIADLLYRFDARYNPVTRLRRASTVKSWLKWVCMNVRFDE